MEKAKAELPFVTYCEPAYEAATGADAVIIATEGGEFKSLDGGRVKRLMARPLILD
jgi:UDPglucose 6-dehydrogenase